MLRRGNPAANHRSITAMPTVVPPTGSPQIGALFAQGAPVWRSGGPRRWLFSAASSWAMSDQPTGRGRRHGSPSTKPVPSPSSPESGRAGLRRRPRIIASRRQSRRDRIIPFRVECVTLDVEGGHLRVGHLDALRVGARIEFTPHRQSGPGRCGSDQFDHRLAAGQGLTSSGPRDVAEQPMLDLVPLRSTGRIVANP
jgi:hypothetical protein